MDGYFRILLPDEIINFSQQKRFIVKKYKNISAAKMRLFLYCCDIQNGK